MRGEAAHCLETRFPFDSFQGNLRSSNRLAEILFIQALRAHIASKPERNKGWLLRFSILKWALP